ncbi:MAG: TldD/PmbA family protein [Myxococcales bacterium]|nr:MAG: TldD/PmbA family protein [Myxococcales bacterium]
MSVASKEELVGLAGQMVEAAKKAGADIAEAYSHQSSHLSTKTRLKAPELVEEAGSKGVGLRVMLGKQVALVHTSDLSKAGLKRTVEDAIELAKLAQEDPFAGPPDASLLSKSDQHVNLDLFDESMQKLSTAEAIERASAGEKAAFDYDSRITNSEGGTFGRIAGASAIVTSGGFQGYSKGTYASLVVSPVADETDGKKRTGYYWSAKRHLAELKDAKTVGEEAARRTLAKLGAQKVATQHAPVVFDPDAARSILSLLASCINGSAIWRKSSYLAEKEGERIASELVNVIDDPLIPRAPGSRPFDGEGLASRRNTIVENGVLRSYLLDSYSARKLGKESTANASRGASGGVSPSSSNFILKPGSQSAEELLASTPKGLYVTDMMGFGFNAITGDFSRGASGFWIENGEKTFPVSEVTISLNIDELLKSIDAIANDLELDTSIAAPTFRVRSMTIAGRD